MQELINKYIQSNQFGKLIGMDFKVLEPGKIEYTLKITKEHLATPSAAHGGVIAALMDGLLGVTGLSAVAAEGKVVSTMEYKISYFNPAFLNDELLGTGVIEKKGSRILFISAQIVAGNRNNEVIAKASGTFNAYPAEKAGY